MSNSGRNRFLDHLGNTIKKTELFFSCFNDRGEKLRETSGLENLELCALSGFLFHIFSHLKGGSRMKMTFLYKKHLETIQMRLNNKAEANSNVLLLVTVNL